MPQWATQGSTRFSQKAKGIGRNMGKSLLHAFPLPQIKVPVPLRGELLHTSGALVFTYGDLVFVVTTQGMPSDHLALEARVGLCSWVQWDYNVGDIGEIVLGRLPLLGHCS